VGGLEETAFEVNCMAALPTVSIGLPVYNGGAYIAEAITSLLAQSHAAIELVISDNCSKDATEAICRRFAERDARIRYQRSTSTTPAHDNFRKALNAARSEFFMWAAHDDRWHPEFVKDALAVLAIRPEIVLATHEFQYMLEDGTPLPAFPEGAAWRRPGLDQSTAAKRLRLMARFNFGNLWYGLFRKSCLLNPNTGKTVLDLYDTHPSQNELPLFFQVAAAGAIHVGDQVRMWKRTKLETFTQAAAERGYDFRDQSNNPTSQAAESTPRRNPLYRLLRHGKHFLRYTSSNAKYHYGTERAISNAVKTLPVSAGIKLRLNASMRVRLAWHFASLTAKKAIGRLD